MVLIRRFEESLLDLFSLGKLAGTTHTYIGQEANAVGVIAHLEQGRDVIVSNHRCHGHYLAFTDDVDGLLGEVMGKASGVCGGKGGSQHLCNGRLLLERRPRAAPCRSRPAWRSPSASAARGAVTTVFIGDGTLGQGVVYESLNIASLWGLPLLVVVENNYYAQSTPSHLTLAGDIADARGGVRHRDGRARHDRRRRDLGARPARSCRRCASSGRPFFLVLDTYRFSPHSKGDDNRDPAEIEEARQRDPLGVAGSQLADDERAQIDEAVERRPDGGDRGRRRVAAGDARGG